MKSRHGILSLLVLALVLGAPGLSSAQILKGLGKRIEKKLEDETNRRVERRVDRTIEKGFDKVEQSAEDAVKGDGTKNTAERQNSSNTGDASAAATRSIFSGSNTNNVTLLDVYDFKLGVSYEIKNDDTDMKTAMWFSDSDYFGMTAEMGHNMFMVLHNGNMINFMLDQKTYMAMGSMVDELIGTAADEASNETEDFSINKVGTERILGYNCDIYEIKSSDHNSKIWLTKEIGLESSNFLGAFSSLMKAGATSLPPNMTGIGGLMLKMEGSNKGGKESVSVEAIEIHKENLKINTSEYKSLGF